jgi:dephospho-CoA kinase
VSCSCSGPFVIGVTGGIACGKSAVLKILGELGAELIDADSVYHELTRTGLPLWRSLRSQFGDEILACDQSIDRRKLGAFVFSDAAALADLDALTHPAVVAEIKHRIFKSASAVIAIDAVKLVESGLADVCDRVWLVTCDPEVQLARLLLRSRLTYEDARRRLAAQPAFAAHAKRADVIIDNSGDIAATREQIVRAWHALPAVERPVATN